MKNYRKNMKVNLLQKYVIYMKRKKVLKRFIMQYKNQITEG